MADDRDCARDIIRYGYPGVEDMSATDLMDEYMNWHGAYSIEECPDDVLLCRMFEESSAHNFEQVVLKEEA